MLWGLLVLLGVAQMGASKALSRNWANVAEMHSWIDIPRGWEQKAPAPSNLVLDLKLGLKQPGMDDLISNLMEISDPSSARCV